VRTGQVARAGGARDLCRAWTPPTTWKSFVRITAGDTECLTATVLDSGPSQSALFAFYSTSGMTFDDPCNSKKTWRAPPMVANKTLRLAGIILLAVLFLLLLSRGVRLGDVIATLKGVTPQWIVAALAALATGYACRIQRWRLMLMQENGMLKWTSCAGPFLISFAANNVLPFRAGDALRSFAFNDRLGVSAGVVIATLLAERLLDFLVILVLFGALLFFFNLDAGHYARVNGIIAVMVAIALALILLCLDVAEPIRATLCGTMARRLPGIKAGVLSEMSNGFVALRRLAQGRALLIFALWSMAAWGLETLTFWFAALAIPALSSPSGGILALPLTAFATLIPSAPGYLGTFDFFAARAMTEFGNSTSAAVTYAALVHVVIWIPLTVSGGLCWLWRARR
jgi:glycosyltransferase 2 family protein